MAHDPPAFIQEYFRIRSDDSVGLNTDSGWAAAENTDAIIGTGLPFRIRFKVRETAAGSTDKQFKPQVNRNSAGWVDLDILGTGAAPAAIIPLSGQYTDGAATSTELLTNTGTYVNGEGRESVITGSLTLTSQETEYEWIFMIMSFHDGQVQNVESDTLDFRIVESDGTVFTGTYTNPTITVTETSGYIGAVYPEHPCRMGPYVDTNGNIYTVIESSVASNEPIVIKSTDGGDTWREIDGANRPTQGDFEGEDLIQVGDTLHIFHYSNQPYYHRFRMSDHATNPDTWEIIDEAIDATVTTHSTQAGSIAVLSSGEIRAFYIDGVSPSRVRYKTRNGTWGSQQTLDSEASTIFMSAFCVLGAADLVHVVYKDDTNGIIYHRSLNSSDTLSGRETIVTGVDTGSVADNIPILPPVYYQSVTDEKIMVFYQITQPGPLNNKVITNDGTPGSQVVSTDNNVERQEGGNQMVIAGVATLQIEVFLFYSEQANRDIWRTRNDDEGGWDTDVEYLDAVEAHWLRGNIITHSGANGGETVFGLIWDNGSDGGTGRMYYDELVVRKNTPVLIPKEIDDVRIRM